MRYHMGTMRRRRSPVVTLRQPNWLLVCAMLALSVHAMASIGLMPARAHAGAAPTAGGPAFFAEICSGKSQPGALPRNAQVKQTEGVESDWDCCELCSLAGAPALPTFGHASGAQADAQSLQRRASAVLAAQADWVLQAPRGPPVWS